MGKRQHQKDKMYITCAEYTQFYGGKKADLPRTNFRRLSFDHCSLSLQPFEYPVCTPDGTVFDILSIVPWIKKYGTNPITGEKLDAKSLIKLNFAKNSEASAVCAVLGLKLIAVVLGLKLEEDCFVYLPCEIRAD